MVFKQDMKTRTFTERFELVPCGRILRGTWAAFGPFGLMSVIMSSCGNDAASGCQ